MSITNALADQIGDKAKPLTIEEWVKNADEKHAVDVTDGKNIYVVEFWATWYRQYGGLLRGTFLYEY